MKRSFLKDLASFFALYGIIFIPFPFYLTNIQYRVTDLVFGRLIGVVSPGIFGKELKDTSVYSDSTSMYILVLLLFIVSLITVLVLQSWSGWPEFRLKVLRFVQQLCVYYLALQLLKYGLDKVFKNQFYLPEPNTLYTPLGKITKDLLYWSSMGTSHFYSVFMGMLETIAAALLLFRKTRLVGLLMSLAIMLNVIAVNFGFDIGVKLYSLFLLFLTIYLVAPYGRRLYQVLVQQTTSVSPAPAPVKRTFPLLFLKWFVIGLILLEALGPFVRRMNFNGDLTGRPYLHGAYQVDEMIRGTDTMVAPSLPVKRLFVHRDGYMIFQDRQDNMQDYKFSYDPGASQYFLTDYQMKRTPLSITYNENDSVLLLGFRKDSLATRLKAKAIDWRKLPALQKGFHWTTD